MEIHTLGDLRSNADVPFHWKLPGVSGCILAARLFQCIVKCLVYQAIPVSRASAAPAVGKVLGALFLVEEHGILVLRAWLFFEESRRFGAEERDCHTRSSDIVHDLKMGFGVVIQVLENLRGEEQ